MSYTVVRIVLSIYTPLSLVEINRKSSRVSLSPQGNRVVRGKKSVNDVTLICSTEGEMQVLLQLRDLVSRRHVIEDKTKAKSSSRCCGWNRGNMDKRLYCGTACTCTSQQHDVTQFQIATMIKLLTGEHFDNLHILSPPIDTKLCAERTRVLGS